MYKRDFNKSSVHMKAMQDELESHKTGGSTEEGKLHPITISIDSVSI